MAEPATAITDLLLFLEGAALAAWIAVTPGRRSRLRWWFVVLFAAPAGGALAGALVHGWFPDATSRVHRALWPLALAATGAGALAAWAIAARLLLRRAAARLFAAASGAIFAAYLVVVLVLDDDFRIALVYSLAAAVYLLYALFRLWRRIRAPDLAVGASGVALALAAGGLQWARIGIHPVHFDHNALYHVLQMIALAMLFRAGRWLLAG